MLISIITPIYKVEKYLDRCIKSIINQTYENLEIILVDDGSPDNCPKICDAWARRDNRIKVIHKKNGGLSDARNEGLKFATGDLISFVDSDDYIAPQMYEKLVESIKNDKSDIAACTVEMVWESSDRREYLTVQENTVLDREEAQKELLNEKKLKQPVWYKLYKREVIDDIFFEKGKYHEDVFWSYQALANASKVSIVDYVGYYYIQREGSIMGEGFSIKRLDALEAYINRYEFFKDKFPQLALQARVSIVDNCIYFGQMALLYMNKEEYNKVVQELKNVIKKYKIKKSDFSSKKFTHRIWITMGQINLRLTCRIKNLLKVGF